MARNSHNICWIKQTKSLKLYLFTCKRQAWDLSGQSTSNSPTFSIIKSFWSWGEVVVNLFTRTLFPIRNWHSEAMRLGNCRTIAHSIAVPTGVWRTVYLWKTYMNWFIKLSQKIDQQEWILPYLQMEHHAYWYILFWFQKKCGPTYLFQQFNWRLFKSNIQLTTE